MFTLTASSLAWLAIKMAGSGLVVTGTAQVAAWFFDDKGGKKNVRKSNRSPRKRREYTAPGERSERQQPAMEAIEQ